MLLLEDMKPLYLLLILALGPALGELTSPREPVPVTVSVSDVHQLSDLHASTDTVNHHAVAPRT
jgi:hypothetical protein